jgi:hypothetical protein
MFDLEQGIMKCWSVTEDINALREQIIKSEGGMTEEDITNYLIGLNAIYQVRFDRLWSLFDLMCREYFKMKKEIPNE